MTASPSTGVTSAETSGDCRSPKPEGACCVDINSTDAAAVPDAATEGSRVAGSGDTGEPEDTAAPGDGAGDGRLAASPIFLSRLNLPRAPKTPLTVAHLDFVLSFPTATLARESVAPGLNLESDLSAQPAQVSAGAMPGARHTRTTWARDAGQRATDVDGTVPFALHAFALHVGG